MGPVSSRVAGSYAAMENPPIFKFGKPSMGHLYHEELLNNQRVYDVLYGDVWRAMSAPLKPYLFSFFLQGWQPGSGCYPKLVDSVRTYES